MRGKHLIQERQRGLYIENGNDREQERRLTNCGEL